MMALFLNVMYRENAKLLFLPGVMELFALKVHELGHGHNKFTKQRSSVWGMISHSLFSPSLDYALWFTVSYCQTFLYVRLAAA